MDSRKTTPGTGHVGPVGTKTSTRGRVGFNRDQELRSGTLYHVPNGRRLSTRPVVETTGSVFVAVVETQQTPRPPKVVSVVNPSPNPKIEPRVEKP